MNKKHQIVLYFQIQQLSRPEVINTDNAGAQYYMVTCEVIWKNKTANSLSVVQPISWSDVGWDLSAWLEMNGRKTHIIP